jgi:SAM-dependent methyltransferase
MTTPGETASASIPFGTYGDYYDLLYADKDYAGEARYIDTLIQKYHPHKGSLLDLGCGTGRHARGLIDLGYQVTGVERSSHMAAKIAPAVDLTCHVGDMTTISLGGQFDTVTALFHVVSYLTTNAQISALFRNVERHLQTSGLFIFDVWYSPAVAAMKPEVRVKRASDAGTEVMRIAEPALQPNENRVDVHYSLYVRSLQETAYRKIEETHRMRHFSIPEMRFLSEAHGFTVLRTEEFLSGREPGPDTWGCSFVLQKAS